MSRVTGTLTGTSLSTPGPPVEAGFGDPGWAQHVSGTTTVKTGYADVGTVGKGAKVYTPGAVTVVLAASGVIALNSQGASLTIFPAGSGHLALTADDAVITPETITPGSLFLEADDASLPGSQAATAGILRLAADPPGSAGPIVASNSGVWSLRADSPSLLGFQTATSGVIRLASDGFATAMPTIAQTGKLVLGADGPTVTPLPASSARLLLAAGAAGFASASVVLDSSGILRLRSDLPIVTPLTEPPEPPPPPIAGTGAHIAVTA